MQPEGTVDYRNHTLQITVDGLIFVGYIFSWFLWRVQFTNSSTNEMAIFSAPEPKAQVLYCDHTLSVVRPSLTFTFLTSPLKPLNRIQWKLTGSKISMSSTKFVFFGPIGKTRWPPRALIGWDTFDFFSKTVKGNSTKLDMKQDLNVLYQVCVFRADRKTKMAAFGIWLAETFLTSPLKPLNRIGRNLTGSKISMCSTKFVFFGPIRKTRWPPWPQICRDIFDFSSETVERNFIKLDRKQDLHVLYQVCVFQAVRKTKMAALATDWWRRIDYDTWLYSSSAN